MNVCKTIVLKMIRQVVCGAQGIVAGSIFLPKPTVGCKPYGRLRQKNAYRE
jgi:hypothetical protein